MKHRGPNNLRTGGKPIATHYRAIYLHPAGFRNHASNKYPQNPCGNVNDKSMKNKKTKAATPHKTDKRKQSIAHPEAPADLSEPRPEKVKLHNEESILHKLAGMNNWEKLEMVAKRVKEDEPHCAGLTSQKICERGEVVNDPSRPSWIVISVTRHRSMIGSTYQRGLPMSAFVTYQQMVALNVETNELQIDDEDAPGAGADISIDYDAYAYESVEDHDFECERRGDGRIVCRETTGKDTRVVATRDDVAAFARDLCWQWYLPLEDDLSAYCSPDQVQDHMAKVVSAMQEALADKAVSAWDNFKSERIADA